MFFVCFLSAGYMFFAETKQEKQNEKEKRKSCPFIQPIRLNEPAESIPRRLL